MKTTDININSASYRLAQRRPMITRAGEIAHLRRYIEVMSYASWTATYKAATKRLAELEAAE